jgi:hypothetical protein
MRIRLTDPALLRDLADFLRRAECAVEQANNNELEVGIPGASDAAQARREISIYVATWQPRNPGIDAQIVD